MMATMAERDNQLVVQRLEDDTTMWQKFHQLVCCDGDPGIVFLLRRTSEYSIRCGDGSFCP